MVMSVNTNISSLNAQQNLAKSQSKLATAIERLSSGMRINSAKDDAAGLAISTRFTTQINGLNQAVSNANDGISLAQTTESALSEVTDNMQRIRQLAVQSANATNSDSDRAALDAEVQQRLAEITRISQQTTFNGRHVLDGSFGQAAFQIGANVGETISVNLSQGAGASQVGSVASASSNIGAALAVPGGLNLAAGDLTVNGTNVAAGNYTTASSLATAINTAAGSSIATVSGNELAFDNSSASAITFGGAKAASLGMSSVAAKGASTTTPGSASSSGLTADITSGRNAITLAAGDFTINGTNVTGTFQNITDLAAAVNAAGVAGVTAADDGTGKLQITNAGGAAATIAGGAATALGVNGSVAASGGTATSTITVASDVSSNANSIKLAAGQLKINGTDLTGVFSDAASLKTLIDGASISGLTTTVSSGELSFSNTSASAVTFSGSLALGLPASVAAQTTTPGADGTATSTGVNAAVTAAGTTSLTLGAGDFTLNGTDITGTFSTSQSVADAVNAKGISGVSAFVDDTGKLEIQSQSALTIAGTKAGAGTGDLGFTTGVTATSGSLATANVKTVASANDVINRIDSALSSISSMRSDLGAVQNRFDSTISNLQTISQNLSSSRSQIQDADFAAETANMSSANILQQAGVSVLAQANSSTQAVLKLLQ